MWIFSLRLQVCTRLQQHENNSGPTQLQATAASTHLLQSCCFFPPKCTETHAGLRYTHARTQLYPAAVFLTVNQWVGLHLQQNDPSRCCFLSPRCLTPPPCCCPAVSLSVFVCASVSLLVCVCVYALEGVYSCQSQAEEAEEEATFSSFSTGLLALCNRSELPLPGSPTSMITTLTESRSYNKNRYDKTEKKSLLCVKKQSSSADTSVIN